MAAESDPWLALCRRAAGRVQEALDAAPTTAERAREVGPGRGGDTTVAIDEAAEDIVFDELANLHGESGISFDVVSEERGERTFGEPGGPRIVVDPIDGSLNAKRGLPHHALSIAVADGPTVADVVFGFVQDFGPGEEWTARRGVGAFLNGVPLSRELGERRSAGLLEIVAIESADPRWVAASVAALEEAAHRVRAIGAIAISLCQVAAARVDAMVSLRACRSFDAAAAALVVLEAGGHVAFPRCAAPLGMPLDLEPHSPVIAARSQSTLQSLVGIPT